MTKVQVRFEGNEGMGITADVGGWLIADFQELGPEELPSVAFDIRLLLEIELLKIFGNVMQDKRFSNNVSWENWGEVVKAGVPAKFFCKTEGSSLTLDFSDKQAERLAEYLADGNHLSSDIDAFQTEDIGTPAWWQIRGHARLLSGLLGIFPDSLPGVIWRDLEPKISEFLRTKPRS